MYLVDTNVWLERLLDQERSEDVGEFLDRVPADRLFMSDFTLHSIGIVLTRLQRLEALRSFVLDTLIDGPVALTRLDPEDIQPLSRVIEDFGLDFDDAYQYTPAQKHDLTLVSFDSDFDRTRLGKRTPAAVRPGGVT